MKRLLNRILTISLMAVTMTACFNDDDGESLKQYTNIVTFTGNRSERAWFELIEQNDSQPVTLFANGELKAENVKAGDRILITYTLPTDGEAARNGLIENVRFQYVYNASVQTADHATAIAANAEIPLRVLFRSGTYINLQTVLPSAKERTFSIIADESTLDSETPHLYVTTTVTGDESYSTLLTASLNIADVWNNPAVKSVMVHINNVDGNTTEKEFEFKKENR